MMDIKSCYRCLQNCQRCATNLKPENRRCGSRFARYLTEQMILKAGYERFPVRSPLNGRNMFMLVQTRMSALKPRL